MFQVIHAMWTMDPAGSVHLDDLQACLDRERKLGRTSFVSNIENSLAHVARCVIFALKPKRFLHSTHFGGGHTRVQNVFGYGTVMQI